VLSTGEQVFAVKVAAVDRVDNRQEDSAPPVEAPHLVHVAAGIGPHPLDPSVGRKRQHGHRAQGQEPPAGVAPADESAKNSSSPIDRGLYTARAPPAKRQMTTPLPRNRPTADVLRAPLP
jgi:hypothetical protein